MKRFCWILLALVLNTGCATHYLWTESQATSFREPASNPELALYADGRGRNVLAVYREMNEQNDRVVSRAYFVIRNSRAVSDAHRPFFVEPGTALSLHPVRLIGTNEVVSYASQRKVGQKDSGWVAMVWPGQQRFALFKDGQPHGTFDLPIYDDGTATAKRVFLTPWTIALDLTVIGGYVYLQAGAPVLWR